MKKIILVILMFGVWNSISGQTLPELQDEHAALKSGLQKVVLFRDSLQSRLQELANRIDREKAESNPRRERIQGQMATALSLTREIEELNRQISEKRKQLNRLEQKLDALYAAKIDSLQKLVEQRILRLSEKRLALSPPLKSLGFNLHTLLTIRLETAKDSTERAIFADYLKNAQKDVEEHLRKIRQFRDELETIAILEEKARDFVDETEDHSDFGLMAQSISSSGGARAATSENFTEQMANRMEQQIHASLVLLNQLDFHGQLFPAENWASPLDSVQVVRSREDQIKLLRIAEKKLEEIHRIILQKSGGKKH
ncbi:hypothetical protein B1H10_06935 [candidate division KSB1 bacterium 4484_188]|nr:MAG: hypothetical protein B1H10_06935 [candidate division KSB1 bacterium 4484_188]